MRRLGDLIVVVDEVLSPGFCEDLINEFEQVNLGDSKRVNKFDWGVDYRQYTELNVCYEACRSRTWAEVNNQLLRRQGELYEEYRRVVDGKYLVPFELAGSETMRIRKYAANNVDQMGWHAEVGDDLTARRAVAMHTFLNDSDGYKLFNGILDGDDLRVEPKTGRMVIYPASWIYPTKDVTPTTGPKYMLTQYVHYV